jgi:hemerythrin HHE cation binding domain-containing protein
MGPIYRFLAADHARLDALLQHAFANPNQIDLESYGQFRAGLLRHIAMEEKILLPAAQKARGGEPLQIAAKLRLDHGALAALLVPTPTAAVAASVRVILTAHNPLEEGPDGLYQACEALLEDESEAIVSRLQSAPEVKLAPFNDGPQIMESVKRALDRAGYALKDD